MLLPVCITLHALTDASSAQSQTATTSVRNECLHGREIANEKHSKLEISEVKLFLKEKFIYN
jgi:hypothetical protein